MKFVPLRELAQTTSGGTPSRGNKAFYGGDIPWLKSGELPDGEIHWVEESISPLGLKSSSAKLLPTGTLLIAMYGATVGKLGVLTFPATTNQAVCAITPSDKLDRDYLFYWLLRSRNQLVETSSGGAQPNISQAVVRDLDVPWVAVPEQRRIAARLKTQLAEVDTARRAAQMQVRDAAALRTKIVDATFNALSDWRPITDAAKVQSGYAFKSESFKPSGVRLLRNTNILPGRVYWDDVVYLGADESERHAGYVLHEGDVLISLDRPLISSGIKVARVGPEDLPALLLQRVGRFQLQPDLLDAGFLFAFLQSTRFIDAISGHEQSLGVPHISPAQVEAVDLPIPPLADQRRIVTRLKAQLAEADAIAQAAATQLAEIDKLPQQLLARAFTTTPGGTP